MVIAGYSEEIAKLKKELERINVVKSNTLMEIQKLIEAQILTLNGNFIDSSKIEKLLHRTTEDYMRAMKQRQDLTTPSPEKFSFENPIVGFGFYGKCTAVECYFIFSDRSKSWIGTTTDLNLF